MYEWNVTHGLGIVWMTLLLNNPGADQGQPTDEGTLQWKSQFGLNSTFISGDPNFSMVVGNSVGTPMFTVIDPRTMTVVYKQEGATGDPCHDPSTCADPAKQQLFDTALANKAAAP